MEPRRFQFPKLATTSLRANPAPTEIALQY